MMEFIKNIARKILQKEIESYKKEIRDMRSDKIDLENSKNREILHWTEETKKALKEKCKVEKENKMLRKYYKLDEEPSDEIKLKIHIDLEVNRLKEQCQMLAIMRNQNQYIQQAYPIYWQQRGFI